MILKYIKCLLFGHIPTDYTEYKDEPDYSHGYCNRCGKDLY